MIEMSTNSREIWNQIRKTRPKGYEIPDPKIINFINNFNQGKENN